MLTARPEEIRAAAHRILASYGAHAVEIARERVAEAAPLTATDIRQKDFALLVLSEVEKLSCRT